METRRILIVSWGIPPRASGSSIVVKNLALAFSSSEILVLGESVTGPEDWPSDGPERVFIPSIPLPPTLRGQRFIYPLLAIPWALLIAWKTIAAARRQKSTDVIAVFPNGIYLFAGLMAATVTGARFFPYLHNTYVENRRGWLRSIAQILQTFAFRRASHVFVMSEGMATLFRERYPALRGMSALVHCFHCEIPPFIEPPTPHTPLRLAIMGSISDANLDAARRFQDVMANLPNAELSLLSWMDPRVVRRLGFTHPKLRHETVSREKLLEKMREADILLLPHGLVGGLSDDEYATIFPTRTIEYLLSGRPIVAQSPPGSYLTRFLLEHDCAVVVQEPDSTALREAILRLQSDPELRSRLVRNALACVQRFHATNVAKELREILDHSHKTDR